VKPILIEGVITYCDGQNSDQVCRRVPHNYFAIVEDGKLTIRMACESHYYQVKSRAKGKIEAAQ